MVKAGLLHAFDEVGLPYGLDPETLETIGPVDPSAGAKERGPTDYKAHTKTDALSGEWILVGTTGRMKPALHVLVKDRASRPVAQASLPSPRGDAYFHDFFWTAPYVVFHLHPALLSPLPMILGLRCFTDSLRWRPEAGSLLVVVDASGKEAPVTLEVPASWMWHTLNAYRAGSTIVADFVGFDTPDHFLGPDAAFRAIMQGRQGVAASPGTLRRFTIDLSARRARLETIAEGHFEFPMAHPGRVGRKHRYAYVAAGEIAEGWIQQGVARIDTGTGARRAFSFGAGFYVGEPVFAPDPAAAADSEDAEDRGWLLCEVLDGQREETFIAVFDAAHVEDGPLARLRLRHHLPMSFHGWWQPA